MGLRGRNPAVWEGDAGYRAALVLSFGPEDTSATTVNAVADLKQRHRESCAAFLDRVILAVDKQHFNLTPAEKQEDGYWLVYDATIMSHFGAGLKDDISKVILGAANPPETVVDKLTAAKAVEAETSKMGPAGAVILKISAMNQSGLRPQLPPPAAGQQMHRNQEDTKQTGDHRMPWKIKL